MINVWPQVEELADTIIRKFDGCEKEQLAPEYEHITDDFTWKNYLWTSSKFRRAHIEIVDATKNHKMWVMHMCIFPHYDSPDPIFGFDVVCGKNKITGAFHDFSYVGDSYLYDWYQDKMSKVEWNKPRELPPWAKAIFSPNMVAAGNIQTQEELDQLVQTVIDNLDYYLYNIGTVDKWKQHFEAQNNYCKNQKLNPHTPAMMVNFGVDKTVFMNFMDEILFPETP